MTEIQYFLKYKIQNTFQMARYKTGMIKNSSLLTKFSVNFLQTFHKTFCLTKIFIFDETFHFWTQFSF